MRLVRFLRSIVRTDDLSAAVVLGLILAIAVWLVLLPVNRSIQQATLMRFHLQSPSFLAWCGLQVVPAMYNMENRYWLNEPIRVGDDEISMRCVEAGTTNHFPTRMLTSFDARYRFYRERNQAEVLLESRFQGQALATRWHVEKGPDNSLVIRRVWGD
jgi:hypothetical protein